MEKGSAVEEELGHIPEASGRPQHLFRLMYRIHRNHSMFEQTAADERRRALIESCSKLLEESFPSFTPNYDEKYFLEVADAQ